VPHTAPTQCNKGLKRSIGFTEENKRKGMRMAWIHVSLHFAYLVLICQMKNCVSVPEICLSPLVVSVFQLVSSVSFALSCSNLHSLIFPPSFVLSCTTVSASRHQFITCLWVLSRLVQCKFVVVPVDFWKCSRCYTDIFSFLCMHRALSLEAFILSKPVFNAW
jgi:hypothetical protein